VKHFHNQQKYIELRKQYPVFVFENYTFLNNHEVLKVKYFFSIGTEFHFTPTMEFHLKNVDKLQILSEIDIRNLVFHIGMIELLSYWKASCSPQIIIKPHLLSDDQINWWKKLYFNGLGEFFYINGIDASSDNFVEILANSGTSLPPQRYKLDEKVMVPIGGGKDSIVSLELLKRSHFNLTPMILNMDPARERTIKKAGYKIAETMLVQRTLDPKLLELNKLGFLNGHTPFSALLAFTCLLGAVLTEHKYIALSNESSANESTVAGTTVNHQYSKSFEFETDFRQYVSEFLSPDFNYFSFLRPLNELQIAKIFSRSKDYFTVFRSCNVGSKSDEWCGKCPKCLFTYIILGSFIDENELHQIFSKNLLNDEELLPVFNELTGNSEIKPFECVGTIDDVNSALILTLKKYKGKKMPMLLKHYQNSKAFEIYKNSDVQNLMTEINPEHYLKPKFLDIIKSELI